LLGREPSGDVDWLLAAGKVERLVREGRPPLPIGTMQSGERKKWFVYQVPPKGFTPENTKKIYFGPGGAYVFVDNEGVQRIGPTFPLTNKQSKLVEKRVDNELIRLGKTRTEMIHLK